MKEKFGRDDSPLTQLQPLETVARLLKRCTQGVIPRPVRGAHSVTLKLS